MIARYRASLNGVQLDSLHDDLLILDIGYTPVSPSVQQMRTANLGGFDIDKEYREKLTVTITFELHIYDIQKRNEACQNVNKWASAGGTFVVNDRKNQHLENVRCATFASIESARNWTDPLTLVFETTTNPYWLDDNENTITLTGISTRGTLKPNGNTGSALVSATVTAGGAISSFQIVSGSTNLKLTGLALSTNQKLTIDYLKGRYLRIQENGRSAMQKLNPSSSDLLLAPCGANTTITITANNRVTAVVKARGLWL